MTLSQVKPLTSFPVPVSDDAIEGLKFAECLPRSVGQHELSARLRDDLAVRACLDEPVRSVTVAEAECSSVDG